MFQWIVLMKNTIDSFLSLIGSVGNLLNEHINASCFHRPGNSFPTCGNDVFLTSWKRKPWICGCWWWWTITSGLILRCRGRQFAKLATHCELMLPWCFTFTAELHPQIFPKPKSSWGFSFNFTWRGIILPYLIFSLRTLYSSRSPYEREVSFFVLTTYCLDFSLIFNISRRSLLHFSLDSLFFLFNLCCEQFSFFSTCLFVDALFFKMRVSLREEAYPAHIRLLI